MRAAPTRDDIIADMTARYAASEWARRAGRALDVIARRYPRPGEAPPRPFHAEPAPMPAHTCNRFPGAD